MHSRVVWREIREKVATGGTGNWDWCVQSTKRTLLGEGETPLGLLFRSENVQARVTIRPPLVLHTSAPELPLASFHCIAQHQNTKTPPSGQRRTDRHIFIQLCNINKQ